MVECEGCKKDIPIDKLGHHFFPDTKKYIKCVPTIHQAKGHNRTGNDHKRVRVGLERYCSNVRCKGIYTPKTSANIYCHPICGSNVASRRSYLKQRKALGK